MLPIHFYLEDELEKPEILKILTEREWLNDRHMDASSALLHGQNKDKIGGFMSVRHTEMAHYPKIENKWIQIFYSPGHWLVGAKGFFGSNIVRVYDRYL